ncbi:Adenosine monophosphate-protein transferase SoFic [bioreactor metagenome]|uniref:Adenosine monophosphate-protein transferase SoFic n=1 Tax=bioreactor metagenome TaxID=1076179 RepID=A0A644XSY3_9ZZZZ|nr:Fic/DOC family N-terminal domain-containing protein [Sphaerochaeta sp.]
MTVLPKLPIDVSKTETIKILKAEIKASKALAELKGIANLIPNQSILINAIVLQESKDSSGIENIITTRDDLYKAVSETARKVDAASKEVMFYREALYTGFNQLRKHGFISINDIVVIQEALVQNDAGLRSLPGTKLVNDKTDDVVYTPPQSKDEIDELLKNFTEYLNNDDDTLEKLAILHYQFESIHPFYDGNGRTGRIINILYLILKDHLTVPILYLSSYIIRNKDEYYRLLQKVRTEEAWEDWIMFILQGIEETAKETIQKVKALKELLDNTLEMVKTKAPKIYSKELVETLFENPYCKIEMVVKHLGVERKAASRYLHQLEDLGILNCVKVGKESIFINIGLMNILKE